MLFYKVEGMLTQEDMEVEDSRRAQRESVRRIFMKSEEFNERPENQDTYCFVAGQLDGFLTAGMITNQPETARKQIESYLEYIGCPLENVTIGETTLNNMQQMLNRSDRGGFLDDSMEIIDRFGIDRVMGRRGRGIEFGENIIEQSNRHEIVLKVQHYMMNESMIPELDRIYAGAKRKVQGHPVHYMLMTDSAETRRESTRLLMQALYANGRLKSRRYCYLNFRPGEDFSLMAYDSLYRVCAGGTVVVRYLASDDSMEGSLADSQRETIEQLCKIAMCHRNQVLTIFCLPRECKQMKEIFYDNLETMVLVELREDLSDHTRAQTYLKQLAKEEKVRTDKALFEKLDPEKSYLPTELHKLFEEWYNTKLRTAVYPQYKDLQIVGKEVTKAAPKGCAYDELQEMIGLTEAKAVIRKALNYYKMQKLYAQKGVKEDSPAMHMVFTGNPGTAKTTVARLFARIMKDNGILSMGQLVEVGRGDLVGKYVGWTAQAVQRKFQEAKGGVLFIDEAYSLVDDRSGSFGDEAINTIVQEMENHRQDVVVIFAGYPNEMERFLQKNPGLRSRVAFHVPFADYNTEELCRIAQLMGKRKGIFFEPAAMEKLCTAFEAARQQSDFGNGRYVRNLLEQAKMNQASRLLEYDFEDITDEAVRTIKAEDITIPEEKPKQVRRTIGFAS